MTSLRDIGEDGLLAAFAAELNRLGHGSSLGLLDDVALFNAPNGFRTVVSMDTMVEGTHFRWWGDHFGPRELGYKLAMSNLSDLASKGARKHSMMLSLGLPADETLERAVEFIDGLNEAWGEWCPGLLGGDTVRSDVWTVTLWVAGVVELNERLPQRTAAEPGMHVYVTGRLGSSAAGLQLLESNRSQFSEEEQLLVRAHTAPTARIAEGVAIRKEVKNAFAMMDLSDGLSKDAKRMAAASNVKIVLEVDKIPFSPALNRYADSNQVSPTDMALYGGEDFELLFATHAEINAIEQSDVIVTRIGKVEEGKGVELRGTDGSRNKLQESFFDHFTRGDKSK